jgi:hypothetical protein
VSCLVDSPTQIYIYIMDYNRIQVCRMIVVKWNFYISVTYLFKALNTMFITQILTKIGKRQFPLTNLYNLPLKLFWNILSYWPRLLLGCVDDKMFGGYREITSYYLYHGDKTLPIDKILSFDIDTTDTQNQQLSMETSSRHKTNQSQILIYTLLPRYCLNCNQCQFYSLCF